MSTLRWGEFADAAINMMARVKRGEKLVVVADTWTDMEMAHACLNAGIRAGAEAQLLVIPRMPETDTRDLSAPAVAAIASADVVLGLSETMFVEKESTTRAREKGTRIAATSIVGMERFAIEGILDVDYPAMVEVAEKIGEMFVKTQACVVSSPLGTDLRFGMKERPAVLGDGMATRPGEADFFPGVSIANAPIESTIEGTLVIDGNVSPGYLVKDPITCHLEKGVIVKIEGGADGSAFQKHLEASGEASAFHLCHFTLGLNPRARTSGSVHQDEHVLGAVTFGFGSQDPDFKGTVPDCSVHSDVVLKSPTVALDGTVLVEANKINPKLGLRKL